MRDTAANNYKRRVLPKLKPTQRDTAKEELLFTLNKLTMLLFQIFNIILQMKNILIILSIIIICGCAAVQKNNTNTDADTAFFMPAQ